ncbi:hypothetical protein ACFLW4_04875 [Chloroflexota bacterium]
MKLGRTSWLIISIGIFIIILAGLGTIRFQQVNEQNQLIEKLALTQSKLKLIQPEQLSHRQEELEQQLPERTSQPETAKAILSQPIGIISISDILFELADANNVEITEIRSSGMAESELEGVHCLALSLIAEINGEVADLVSFITRLNDDLATGVINSLEINIPGTTDENKSSANIQLIIYTYQGD